MPQHPGGWTSAAAVRKAVDGWEKEGCSSTGQKEEMTTEQTPQRLYPESRIDLSVRQGKITFLTLKEDT